MIQGKRILAIGAHPDDIEFGCLGFLLKSSATSKLHIYIASLGSEGDPTSGPARKHEGISALEKLCPASLRFREKVGIAPGEYESVLNELTSVIEEVQPDLILTLGPNDTHQEHRILYEITLGATRRSKASILTYGIVSNTPAFLPDVFVDITEYFDKKLLALKQHASQLHRPYMDEDYLRIFHSSRFAANIGARYCEVFKVVRLFL